MDVKFIDINCDVGEGIGNEAKILPLISSCNIATGGHAGTDESMRTVIRLAKTNNVKIGAHPSYPDKENFGRKTMELSGQELANSIENQLSQFQSILHDEEAVLHHIKPHGALYNDIAKNVELANSFLKSIDLFKENVCLYVPYNSAIAKSALTAGFKIKYEAFGDRNYNSDGSLVSRTEENALILNPEKVLKHISLMALEQEVQLPNHTRIAIKADTYCIHGDTRTAHEILQYLSKQLPENNIIIQK